MTMAKVGVLLEKEAVERRWRYGLNVFQKYVEEVLAHAGIPFSTIDSIYDLSKFDVVIAAVTGDDAETAEKLWSFAEAGGVLISFRGLNKLAAKLNCAREHVSGTGYARIGERTIRYLEAEAWSPAEGSPAKAYGTLHAASPDGATIGSVRLSFQVGKGRIHRWAVDIPSTMVAFQQGFSPVIDDGVPAKDGTGAVDDFILKADDRCAMDWELDRTATETGQLYFAHPYADYWREELIGHLLQAAAELGYAIPFLDEWPDGVQGVAMISLDSDLNADESAITALDVFQEFGVRTTWCIIAPGFSEFVYDRAKKEGHELAMHYNALEKEDGEWSYEAFCRQFEWVKQATKETDIKTNKNHYTRFEGWGEFFRWCESVGIESDQTRGPSKKGNIGFPFGTAHPYRPIAWFDEQNRLYDVVEIGFLTQDLNHHSLADDSVVGPFLEKVSEVRGVAHFLFHQYHILNQLPVREALRKVIREAHQRGYEFWTNREINAWERSRRTVRLESVGSGGEVKATTDDLIKDAVIWIPAGPLKTKEPTEVKYGVPCIKRVIPSAKGVQVGG